MNELHFVSTREAINSTCVKCSKLSSCNTITSLVLGAVSVSARTQEKARNKKINTFMLMCVCSASAWWDVGCVALGGGGSGHHAPIELFGSCVVAGLHWSKATNQSIINQSVQN